MKRALLALGLLFAGAPALAQPLTLEQALASVAEAHPDLRIAEADRAMALAERDLAGARSDWNLNLEAGLRRAKPTRKTSSAMRTKPGRSATEMRA